MSYTPQQQADTLAGLAVIREQRNGGPEYAVADAAHEVVDQIKKQGGLPADGLAGLVAGLSNAAVLLLTWIENQAEHKELLLADVRRRLPDYEEPDTYPTDPRWSTWDGVLRAIEKAVRDNQPTLPGGGQPGNDD